MDSLKIPGIVDVAANAFSKGWVETAGWLAYKYVPDNATVIDAEISGGPRCKTSARKKANVSLA